MLKRIYLKYKLNKYSVVITGYICIGRGISFMDENIMFDYAILSQYNNKNDASQMAGRLKGNIKLLKNYKKPIVFTTDKFNEIAYEWEEKSRNLARLAFEKEQNGILTIVTKNEFNTCNKNYDYIIHDKLFNTYKEATEFLNRKDIKDKMGLLKEKNNKNKKNPIHLCDKYAVTSKLLKPEQTVTDLSKEMRITKEMAKNIPASRCISSTDKGSRYLILPIYDSLDTLPDKEKYQVRYISFK
jgi:hypothetical protein